MKQAVGLACATSGAALYYTTDGNTTWQSQSVPGLAYWNSISCSADGMRILACASLLQSLWLSVDGGANWTAVSVDGGTGHDWASVVVQQ